MEINYKNLNVLDYVSIDKRNKPESIIKSYNSAKKIIGPVYNITDEGLTNLTKYCFYIELEIFGDENLIQGFRMLQTFDNDKCENPNVFIADIDRNDYCLKEIENDVNKPYIYHVLIDTNNPNYAKAMTKIRKSWLFKGEYIYQDVSTEKIVVLLHACSKKRIEQCRMQNFSELFSERNSEILTSRDALAVTYFEVDTINVEYRFTEASAVLAGIITPNVISCEAERLIEELGIDCPKTIALLYERHGYPDHEILK
jgi:hypothetical protein